jgi:Fe-S-cluster containining protein
MDNTVIPLSLDDAFQFSCSEQVACFNECCRDLNQFLTPYDILRLKRHLGISSQSFLQGYTVQHIGPESGLPIISLKAGGPPALKCPFVTPSGCSVYEDRPSSCRTYPVARVISRCRETSQTTERFMLIKEPHCQGFLQAKTQTVREWIESQGISVYNEMNDGLMEIISLKNRLMPGPLDLKDKRLMYMALYDLDAFRAYLFDRGALEECIIGSEAPPAIETDDVALLKFAFKWIRHALFGKEAV